jgi:hypothetical protein
LGAGRKSFWISIRSILVYDMYPWDKHPGLGETRHAERTQGVRLPAPRDGGPSLALVSPAGPAPAVGLNGSAARAVQVALDRRDNGGDAAAAALPAGASGQTPAGPTRQ